MKFFVLCLAVGAGASLAACVPKDTVVFVTNTSLGLNVESKPPTASVAYDRVEGYMGPRTANGGLPPVVASIQTGGNFFNPTVRQVYATGAAAQLAVDPHSGAHGPADMTGATDDNRLVFFGTATTIGLKVGFDETTALPDTLVFGFKRKELSVIPLGSADGKRVYPSVLASVDTTVATEDFKKAGLSIDQFIATGAAAESLALTNKAVKDAFGNIVTNAVTATLTDQQKRDAAAAATGLDTDQAARVVRILKAVTAADGTLDKTVLNNAAAKANQGNPKLNLDYTGVATTAQFTQQIQHDDTAAKALDTVLSAS